MTKKTLLAAVIFLSISAPISVVAVDPPLTLIPYQVPGDPPPVQGCNFLTGEIHYDCIPNYLAYIIQFIFGLTGAACLLMIIIAGFQVALAKALGKDRTEGLTRLKVALIGFIMCGLSWFILDFIISSLAGI